MAEPVTVQITPKWVSLIKSPLMVVVWALQGLAVSFAPLFLYWSGKGWFFPATKWIVVPLCFAIILGVSFFYMSLANLVVAQVRRKRDTA